MLQSYFSFKANQQSQLDSRKLSDDMVREKLKHYKAKNGAREKKEKNRRLEGFVITIEDMFLRQVLIFTNFIRILYNRLQTPTPIP